MPLVLAEVDSLPELLKVSEGPAIIATLLVLLKDIAAYLVNRSCQYVTISDLILV